MGRRQIPLDGHGQVVRFATKLRQARESAGLTLRKLAEVSGYSTSTLSTAENGRKLPSWDVVAAFVSACGETDLPRWRGWWDAAEDERAEPVDEVAPPAERLAPAVSRRLWVGLAIAATVILAAVITDLVMTLGGTAAVQAPRSVAGQTDPIADGSDPTRAGCGPDAVTMATVRVHFPIDQLSGEVELRYSPHCRAAWGRFEPADGWHPGTGMMVTVWTIRPADQANQSYSVTFGGEAIIGNLLMTAPGCVAAEVTMVQGVISSPVATTTCVVIN